MQINPWLKVNPGLGDFNPGYISAKARRTLELSAELSVTRDCWRKQVSQVCGDVLRDFRHACH